MKRYERARRISRIFLKFGIDLRKKLFREIRAALGNPRFYISGAAAIDPRVLGDFRDIGIETIQGYGLTETSPVLCAENRDYIKTGSVGKPIPETEVRILNPDSEGVGELAARGPGIMKGYYRDTELTEEVLNDGWFRTGDFAEIDKEGFVYIRGRKKDVIVLKNGKNVYPEEIEMLLNKLPYVKESVVFPFGSYLNPKPAAKLVCTVEKDIREVWKDIKDINEGLARYKHIEYLCLGTEDFPKTSTAKIKKTEVISGIKPEEVVRIS